MHWRQWWWAQSRRKTSPSYYAIYQYHSRITSKNQPPLFYGRSNKHYHTNNKLQCYYHVVMMWGAQTRKWVRLKIYNRLKDREMVWQEGQNMTWSQRQQKDLARSLRVYIMNERLRVQVVSKLQKSRRMDVDIIILLTQGAQGKGVHAKTRVTIFNFMKSSRALLPTKQSCWSSKFKLEDIPPKLYLLLLHV